MKYLLGLSENEGTLLQSNMPLSQMIIHATGSLLDPMVQQRGGVMPALLPAWHAVPGTKFQVAQLGWQHSQDGGTCMACARGPTKLCSGRA